MNLDGKDTIRPTPFNAHEQVVRGTHTHSARDGYKAAEYKPQEFPKAIDHDKETGEPIVATSPGHERTLRQVAKDKDKEE